MIWKEIMGMVSHDPSSWTDDIQIRRQYYLDVQDILVDTVLDTVSYCYVA